MVDVLLICPRANRPFHHKYVPLSPPLGLGYIAKALDENGISFKLIDMYCTPLSLEGIKNQIIELKPRMIGFMVYTESVNTTYEICKAAKTIDKNIITVAGGPHPTFKRVEILDNMYLDISIAHEGEETIIELWSEINKNDPNLSLINGVCYKNGNNEIIINPLHQPINNLNKFSFPKREWYPNIEKYLEPSTIISSRGCPGKCSFCGGANISYGLYRTRDINSVKEEAKYLKSIFPNDSTIFWDDAFGYDTKRLESLCQMFKSIKPFYWSCGLRVDRVNKELLELMGETGCVKINFGVESGSQQILNESMKGISIEQIIQAVKWANHANIYNSCSIIVGHPNDTHETIKETLKFAEFLLNNGATSCTFNAMIPFPGTYLYENKDTLEIKMLAETWEDYNFLNPVFETKYLNINDIRRYLIEGLILWSNYKNNREEVQKARLEKRDLILLGDFLGRNVQT